MLDNSYLIQSEEMTWILMFFDINVLGKMGRNHNFKIRSRKTHTNYFKFSFFNHCIMHAPS